MARRKRTSYYDNYWPTYEATRPVQVKGGIVAQSQRGAFVKNWWADRWIDALKRLIDSGRLSRGRSYARRGQVLEIDVQPGVVTARVQGSRPRPYGVQIGLRPLSPAQWAQVLDAIAAQAIFGAQLLNGEMPPDIEQVFQQVQVPLFPAARGDLATDCTCPDWANPCKHVAAVYYLLGERFDQDPFLLFTLRGMNKDQIIAGLRARRAGQAVAEEGVPYAPGQVEAVDAPPLAEALDGFWRLGPSIERVALHIAAPAVDMALLKRLGAPEFVDARTLWAQMSRVYDGVSARATELAFADASPARAGEEESG